MSTPLHEHRFHFKCRACHRLHLCACLQTRTDLPWGVQECTTMKTKTPQTTDVKQLHEEGIRLK